MRAGRSHEFLMRLGTSALTSAAFLLLLSSLLLLLGFLQVFIQLT